MNTALFPSAETDQMNDAAATIVKEEHKVARPLKVLVPLIKQDIQAAQNAGMPYYRAAGEKLIEAKSQLAHGEWQEWLKRNFSLTARTAQNYMQMADAQKRNVFRFSSLNEFKRQRKAERAGGARDAQPIGNKFERMANAFKEQKLLRKLAIEIIDAGYRHLSAKYHPDKGGDSDTMRRLSDVRKALKHAVEKRRIELK